MNCDVASRAAFPPNLSYFDFFLSGKIKFLEFGAHSETKVYDA